MFVVVLIAPGAVTSDTIGTASTSQRHCCTPFTKRWPGLQNAKQGGSLNLCVSPHVSATKG